MFITIILINDYNDLFERGVFRIGLNVGLYYFAFYLLYIMRTETIVINRKVKDIFDQYLER